MAANQQGYFFTNPFMNLTQPANTLRLPFPLYLSYARAKGLKLHNLRGIYVLVDGKPGDFIYVIQSSADAAKLRLGTKYRAYHCGIQPDDVDLSKPWDTRVNGATFWGEGDKSKVPVRFEQEFAG